VSAILLTVSAILIKPSEAAIISMNTGFTWDTQNQEFDKKMALETWQQAEQYLKDKIFLKHKNKYNVEITGTIIIVLCFR
jgi:ATP:corrinoid adenosyltransferase